MQAQDGGPPRIGLLEEGTVKVLSVYESALRKRELCRRVVLGVYGN